MNKQELEFVISELKKNILDATTKLEAMKETQEESKCHTITLGKGNWQFGAGTIYNPQTMEVETHCLGISRNETPLKVGTILKDPVFDKTKEGNVIIEIPTLECLEVVESALKNVRKEMKVRAKVERMKNASDLRGLSHVYIATSTGTVTKRFINKKSVDVIRNSIKQGNGYFDIHSARLVSIRTKVLHKIWCKFGDAVVWLPFKDEDCSDTYQGVHFLKKDKKDFDDCIGFELNKLLNRLTKEELKSIKGE